MNINSINVNKYPISQLFDPDTKTVYEIPKYQREYVWGMWQWASLYNDLSENAEGYFLGSIICINASSDTLNPKFEVVDGQQRLTTISLFLAALHNVLSEYKADFDEEQLSDLLQLKRKLILKKSDKDLRMVLQVQGNNQADYKGLLSQIGIIKGYSMPSFAGLRRIVKGYKYFRQRIVNDLVNETGKLQALFKILEKINSAILVMIEVSNHADAYTLFESLNNRGTPLTSVDLIKNLLLAKLDSSSSADLDYYFSRWQEVLVNLGDEYSTQERFFRQNYNAFRKELNAPFVKDVQRPYPLGTIATRSSLLDIYEKLVVHDPVFFLDEIVENSKIYSTILVQGSTDISTDLKETLLDLQRVQGAPAYLFILYLMKKKGILSVDDAAIIKMINLLIKFFIRRNVTDVPPTRDITRLFMSFIEEIEKNNYTGDVIYTNLRAKLLDASAPDDYFSQKLHGPIYEENSGAVRFILCMIAKTGMTRENKVDLWKRYDSKQYIFSIEHIFPQGENIPKVWVDMIANGDVAKAKEYQMEYVHTLGNLTITAYNSTLSNKGFTDKRDRKDSKGEYIGYKNNLNLNADLATKDTWTIEDIKTRTDKLIQQILKLFEL